MNGIDGNTLTIIITVIAMTLGLRYFQSKRIAAWEKMLRDEIRAFETRLGARIDGTNQCIDDTNAEIKASEIRLRGEIKASETRLDRRIDETNRRIDETNTETRILINDIGVIKGALGVATQTRERALAERT